MRVRLGINISTKLWRLAIGQDCECTSFI